MMSDFLALWHSPTTLVFLIGSAALLVFWRLSNARITLRWDARTHAAEPSATELAEIEIAKLNAAEERATSIAQRTPTVVYEERKL